MIMILVQHRKYNKVELMVKTRNLTNMSNTSINTDINELVDDDFIIKVLGLNSHYLISEKGKTLLREIDNLF